MNKPLSRPTHPPVTGAGLKFLYDPRRDGIRQTYLNAWQTCREAARLGVLAQLVPNRKRQAFADGTFYHSCLEEVYKAIKTKRIDRPAQVAPFIESFVQEHESELRFDGRGAEADQLAEAYDAACALIPAYFEHYQIDFKRDWVAIEEKFIFMIGDIKITGTMDGGYLSPRTGKFWVLENKFKARWPANIADYLPLDLQVQLYCAAAWTAKRPVAGCLYNLIRKPTIKRKKNESRGDFFKRLREDIKQRPTWYYERHQVDFCEAELAAARRRVTHLSQEFLRWYDSVSPGKKDPLYNSTACENKYGTCQFLGVCGSNDFGNLHVKTKDDE